MNAIKEKIFKFTLYFVGLYHLTLGLGGIFLPESLIVSIVNAVYGIVAPSSPEFLYLVRFISVYFLFFGSVMILAALNIQKYAKLAWFAIGLFLIRATQRIVLFSLLSSAFQVTFGRNLITVFAITTLAIILYLTMPKSK